MPPAVRAFGWVVALTLGGWAAVALPGLRVDTAPVHMLPRDHEEVRAYRHFQNTFGGDDVVVVALRGSDLFAPEMLARLEELTAKLESIPGVAAVLSPTRVPRIASVGSFPVVRPGLPATPEEAADFLKTMREAKVYRRVLVSEDGQTVALLVDLDPDADERAAVTRIEEVVEARRDRMKPAVFHLSGLPFIRVGLERAMVRPFAWLLPILIAALFLATWRIARSPRAAVLVTGGALAGLAAAIGVMSAFRWPLHAGNWAALPVAAIGGAVLGAVAADARLRGRCVTLSAAAMALAPAAMLATSNVPHRQLGAAALAGLAVGLLFVLFARPTVRPVPEGAAASFPSDRRLLFGGMALVPLLGFGVARWKYDANFLEAFPPSHPILQDLSVIDRELTGIVSLQIVIRGQKGDLRKPEALRAIQSFQTWADAQPGVRKTVSVVDALAEAHCVSRGRDPRFRTLPEGRALATCLMLLEFNRKGGTGRLVTADYSEARLSLTVASVGTAEQWEFQRAVGERLKQDFGGRWETSLTGLSRLWAYLESGVPRDVGWAGGAMLVGLALLQALFLRGTGWTILAPAAALAGIAGLMGWLAVRVNLTTSAIPLAGIVPALGLAAVAAEASVGRAFRAAWPAIVLACFALAATGFRLHIWTGTLCLLGLLITWAAFRGLHPGALHDGRREAL